MKVDLERCELQKIDIDRLLDNFVEETGILYPVQIENFNNFIISEIPEIIRNMSEITLSSEELTYDSEGTSFRIYFTKPTVHAPRTTSENQYKHKLTPNEARNRNCSYLSDITVDIHVVTMRNNQLINHTVTSGSCIAKIPMMVGSCRCNLEKCRQEQNLKQSECKYDVGGYFIIKGKERCIVGQERICQNFTFFQKTKNLKWPYMCEVRNTAIRGGRPSIIQIKLDSNYRQIVINRQFFLNDVDLSYLLVCLGLKYEDIMELQLPHGKKMFKAMNGCNHDRAFEVLKSSLVCEYNEQKPIEENIFLGIHHKSKKAQAIFLLSICEQLVNVSSNKCTYDDRDHWANKRVDMAGDLFRDLFRILFKNYMKQFKVAFNKNRNINSVLVKLNSITSGFKVCMNTGNWGTSNSAYKKIGVSQILNRLTHASMISHLRRITATVGKEGKLTKLRQIHQSQWGVVCPSETPEGQSCGVVKNFSLLTRLTIAKTDVVLQTYLENSSFVYDLDTLKYDEYNECIMISVNGGFIGYTKTPELLKEDILQARMSGTIDRDVSCAYCEVRRKIIILTDGSRCTRPLFNLKELRKLSIEQFRKSTWKELVYTGVIEYIDKQEESYMLTEYDICNLKNLDATHADIDPSMILGVAASCIPYANHNQAPRNCYQAAMGKQAIGLYCSNHQQRFDTIAHVALYPQPPNVFTTGSRMIKTDQLPAGQNVIVAIACYGGFNQEDSVILNQSSIDRGLFMSVSYKTLVCEEKKTSSNLIELFGIPPENIRKNNRNYNLLDEDGFIRLEVKVTVGDVLVGKMLHKGDDTQTDCSLIVKSGEEGIVENVMIVMNEDGLKCAKIKIRSLRIPEVGDKIASRAAQKGTIGLTLPASDMPFTNSGIVPDVIINPHCMPSRMTIGQLLECLTAKAACFLKKPMDSTPFRNYTPDDIGGVLVDHGYEMHGNEDMISGYTGEHFNTKIFIGPTYYQRLKHMISDKIHARSHGNIQLLTRQPLEGRSRDGGLRFGEMERDAQIAHGCSYFIKDRLFDQSDVHISSICKTCGIIGKDLCANCNGDDFGQTNLPYATNILIQELQSTGMDVRLSLKST